MLENVDYADTTHKLSPDIIIGLADMPYGESAGRRRMQKMSTRTEKWTKNMANINNDTGTSNITRQRPSLFVPILPISREAQDFYLELLADELKDDIDGLALYATDSFTVVPASLCHLPRIAMTGASRPQDVLRDVELGADMCAIPYINAATDAGIALDFVFPVHAEPDKRLAMGIDMWTADHATDVSPLTPSCGCYTCQKHHRAYIQHLLSAKEMLAWVLLQIHNLKIMDDFFAGIRRTIQEGTFENEVKRFGDIYEAELPTKTGQGPRYGYKSFLYIGHLC